MMSAYNVQSLATKRFFRRNCKHYKCTLRHQRLRLDSETASSHGLTKHITHNRMMLITYKYPVCFTIQLWNSPHHNKSQSLSRPNKNKSVLRLSK